MAETDPAIVAAIDQSRAELDHLIGMIREHQAGCPHQDASCPGREGVDRIVELACTERGRVLVLALGELARSDYGRGDKWPL